MTRQAIRRWIVGALIASLAGVIIIGCCTPTLSRARRSSIHVAQTMVPSCQYLDEAGGYEVTDGSLPSRDEELWVIQRAEAAPGDERADGPGCGVLRAKLAEEREVPLPLKHTDVQAAILGYIGTVDVTQQYHNPYESKIEAVYVFPLPHNAAVREFVMTIGERRIRGIIRERAEAEEIYRQARSQGYVASLMTQERPNIFTQSVANIEPGKAIDIHIRYFHTLAYDDGWYEFVFPMVVGPRFNPPGSTDGVGAVARGSQGASGQSTEVQYLNPGERSGHDIALTATIDAGVAIEELRCTTHVTTVTRPAAERAEVKLSRLDVIPNRDFVLRYKVTGGRVKSSLMTAQSERGGYFTLMLFPPDNLRQLTRTPLELVFVLDCSGSMNGQPIAQAKTAVERALKHMQPDDSFQIIRFSNDASQLGPQPITATPANVRKGLAYLRSLNGEGGTMMIEGIKAALDFKHDPRRLRFVCFLTDGYIGNDVEILGEVHKRIGASRIFSFGVGSGPNRYLLDHMAKIGRGAVAYLDLKDSAAEVMDRFLERISHPAMTDLEIDWAGMKASDVYPARTPDLFVGRPVILTGRCNGAVPPVIRVRGRVGDGVQTLDVPVNGSDAAATALPAVWARMKIADLGDRATYQPSRKLDDQIRTVALEYGLMSAYTAFIAVDSTARTAGDHGTTVQVPVSVPEGVRYDTTVTE